MDNVYLSADEYIEYTCEQADKMMQMKLGKSYTTYVKNIGNKIHCIHNHKNNYRTWMTNPIQKKMQKKYVENGTERLPIEKSNHYQIIMEEINNLLDSRNFLILVLLGSI